MAKFLTRKGIVYHLDRIIEEAERELVLISPYIKADDDTKDLLKNKTRDTTIDVIYGKKELSPSEKSFLDSLGIKTSFLKDLHAKCYLNENEALLTSMNLYRFSQEHNDEMGILVSRQDDKEIYEAIRTQAMRWRATGGEVKQPSRKPTRQRQGRSRKQGPTQVKPRDGYCIRCKDLVAAKPERPYCSRCYARWKRYQNDSYKEKHCHTCGRQHGATLLKPLCGACYAKYKDLFNFAVS